MLTAAGYKVGPSTSSHLVDLRGHIWISDEMISEEEAASSMERIRSLIRPVGPSLSEHMALMVFEHLHTHEVDYTVIEAGLGG